MRNTSIRRLQKEEWAAQTISEKNLFNATMSEPKKIIDLKLYASKILSDLDKEISNKNEEIEKLKSETEELSKQKSAIQQILEKIEEFEKASSAKQSQKSSVTVKAKVEVLGSAEPRGPPVGAENQAPIKTEAGAGKDENTQTSSQKEVVEPEAVPIKKIAQSEEPATPFQKPFNGEKKWETISVNNVEYARYYVGKSSIDIEFKFNVPMDSKYVKGFIIEKYLQKLKEEGSQRVSRGEVPAEQAFGFDVKSSEHGEIMGIKIQNFGQEQVQDLLNKIKWFIASEVRDLKSKGKVV